MATELRIFVFEHECLKAASVWVRVVVSQCLNRTARTMWYSRTLGTTALNTKVHDLWLRGLCKAGKVLEHAPAVSAPDCAGHSSG